MLPLVTLHFPKILCAQGRRLSKWLTRGNSLIRKENTTAFGSTCSASSMGINNQKMYCDRRESTKRNKSTMTGINLVNNPIQFKGLAHTESERVSLGLQGLMPPAVRPVNLQVEAALDNLHRYGDDLSRYLFLRELQDTNERLFYRILCEHTEELMPLVYTPVVGQACQEYSRIFRRPRGVFISINDLGNVYNILGNWPEENVKAIVVTDGERILGLGDLGANGMCIPVGKMALYTALAGIPPSALLPVTLDVGTNNEKLLNDPLYIGLKQKRVSGEKYDQLIDEFMKAVVKRYGKTCLIQFEDFGNQNAFRLLEKYTNDYCTFNDDIQGTASVAVAGILASVKITGTKVSEHTFLFYGAGEAALGIADLIVMEMEEEGVSTEDARNRIWMVDSRGLVVTSRTAEGLKDHKKYYAKEHEPTKNLEEMMEHIKPTVLIGASAQPGVFTPKVLSMMINNAEQPIVFALSNPTDKAECTAEAAYTHTKGKCIFASGSPFPAFTINGKTFHPGQGNNAYIFPGVSLALLACGARSVGDKVFLIAAKALAEQVTKEDMDEGRVYPPLHTIRKVSLTIAAKVARFLYQEGLATYKPEPPDLETFLATKQYNYDYEA
ncbi:NADP-dependent malic enzyme [Caerostris darwini]|uniref:Malic enzyme n=2 Tax=Caerostris TaxID=172845 RepID=A0AAV4SBN0_9ARAC|nr:NADP-dependent malic enzyme [Caerostris darwini]